MNLRSILPILCGALACAALTVHDTSDAHAGNKYGIALTKLDASLKGGQLTLSYGMKHTTLMSLRGAKIKPSVELYEVKTGRFMHSFPMTSQSGSLTFPKDASFARGATYSLKMRGAHKAKHLNREVRFVRQGNLCVLSGLAKSKKR